jgi:adenosylhomocysteine nucleosidase
MPSELRPVVRAFGLRPGPVGDLEAHTGTVGDSEVVATTTGIGTARATAAVDRLLAATDVDHVVVVGIAGGIGPTVSIRDVVIPEVVTDWPAGREYRPAPLGDLANAGRLVTSDEYGYSPRVVAGMIDDGVVAVDMETAAVAAACEARGQRWSAVRAISDRADDDTVDEAIIGLAKPDGSPDFGAALRYLARRPWRIRRLAVLGRDATAAARAAAEAAAAACCLTARS